MTYKQRGTYCLSTGIYMYLQMITFFFRSHGPHYLHWNIEDTIMRSTEIRNNEISTPYLHVIDNVIIVASSSTFLMITNHKLYIDNTLLGWLLMLEYLEIYSSLKKKSEFLSKNFCVSIQHNAKKQKSLDSNTWRIRSIVNAYVQVSFQQVVWGI